MDNNRRSFLRLLGLSGFSVAALSEGQESHGQPPPRLKTFQGVSKSGDVAEALHKAISRAQGSVRHPDAMVEWTLKRITGRSGGFAGFNEVTVVIEAALS
jgi:hypothetical protein